jgi:uncharacterized membrane protein (UPF0127 family)
LEIADNEAEREKGLSGRQDVPVSTGMLFIFDVPGQHCFWMKDTLVPLDMLWFDTDHKLVYQQLDAQPDSYPQTFCPDSDALYVVELRAGTAAQLRLKTGDTLTLE